MLHALRLAGRAGGVEDEQRGLGVDPYRVALRRLTLDGFVPPDVTLGVHADRLAGTAQHAHALPAGTAGGERLVGGALELDHLAAAPAAVGRDHQPRLR